MTPTTDEMRNVYATGFVSPNPLYAVECVAAYDEFDAWLTAHDAEVREQAAQRIYAALSGHSDDVDEGLCLAAESFGGVTLAGP